MTNISPLALAALSSSAVATAIVLLFPLAPVQAFASPPARVFISSSSGTNGKFLAPLQAERGKFNPLGGFLGDVASSLFSSTGPADPEFDSEMAVAVSSSWDDIRKNLESKQTKEEKHFRSNLAKGYGSPSPLHKLRLFDDSNREEDIRVTLYRDSASWCPYCQKVWMTLEEKRIPYRVEKINMRCYGEKPASFNRMQPSGAIPVAIIDGTTYNQSNDIMYALESLFSDHKSLSPRKEDRAKAQELLRLERQIFSAWMYWLTGSPQYRDNFIAVLLTVEGELKASQGGDFFLGKDVSIVDFMFAPFLERMTASMVFFKGFQIRVARGEPTDFPAINSWFDAMEELASYQLTKSDFYTHCWDLPPQLGGSSHEDSGEPFERAINGERTLDGTRGSWELPLLPHNGGIEPDWEWVGDEAVARREATERLSYNHNNIVKFAARGAGKKGIPSYSAPLADPNAISNEAVVASIDAVLRLVAVAMLEGVDCCEEEISKLAEKLVTLGGKGFSSDVVASLGYLR
mmetsp:Transcript_32273/g.96802  ORF Transcript_32273/g.96802 Transcript_32273/m.96802 type:complete len:518 (-) Transcript_32273:555-2108(-)